MKQTEEQLFQLRPYTIAELADIYGVSKKTFRRWLDPFQEQIGKRNGFFYSIVQVKIIFDKLGIPGSFYNEQAA
jgi:response regulator of citrate/malate metabolism